MTREQEIEEKIDQLTTELGDLVAESFEGELDEKGTHARVHILALSMNAIVSLSTATICQLDAVYKDNAERRQKLTSEQLKELMAQARVWAAEQNNDMRAFDIYEKRHGVNFWDSNVSYQAIAVDYYRWSKGLR